MQFAARLNSFITTKLVKIEDIISYVSKINKLTHIDLNYPEHLNGISVYEMQQLLSDTNMQLHGLAMRFRNDFIQGEYGNIKTDLSNKAVSLTKEAIDICKDLNGENITVWLGYDGFDYSFQVDYKKALDRIVEAFKEVCSYASLRGMKVSIEYKPYEPRAYSMIDGFGTAMYVIEKVGMPNLGLTLDFCHMLMKKENPAYGLDIALSTNRLHAIHLNDGYGTNDDGFMIGSINFTKTLEFIYYLKKYKYDGMIYFDTFPIREDAVSECNANIRMFDKINSLIDDFGVDRITELVKSNDAVSAMQIIHACLR